MNQELIELMFKHKPDFEKLPGGVRIKSYSGFLNNSISNSIPLLRNNGEIIYVKKAITTEDCDRLIELMQEYGTYAPVSVQGVQEIKEDTPIGSKRITGFSPELAVSFFEQLFINQAVHLEKICNVYTPTDWWQEPVKGIKRCKNWEFSGVSPMFRFMKYEKYGLHYPHYDAGFIYPDSDYRTLKSFVLYLTTNKSGATRFIKDSQSSNVIWTQDHSDWHREPYEEEIAERILPIKGDMLIFDHKLCHDVEAYNDQVGDRIIIRGDLIYRKIK